LVEVRNLKVLHFLLWGRQMTLQVWAWLAAIVYALHVMEEHTFNWRDWARGTLGLPAEWSDFYVTNAAVIVLGVVAAELAPTLPVIPLAYAALMLINAVLFHFLPMIRFKGRFSPGAITAALLFLPVGIEEFFEASREGVLSGAVGSWAFIVGAVLMAFPIVMLRMKLHSYFQQDLTIPTA
jgi:hypothetical protein